MSKILNLFNSLYLYFKPRNELNRKVINEGVKKVGKKYGTVLKFLDKYDKGEVTLPKHLVGHTSLRGYLRSVPTDIRTNNYL